MTQEEKQLLIKDICARLPYWPHIKTLTDDDAYIVGLDDTEEGLFYVHVLEDGDSYDAIISVENFKPYLRLMTRMTEDEDKEFTLLQINFYSDGLLYPTAAINMMNWLNAHHFDYYGLIEKGLALEAPEGTYKTE